MKMYQIGIFAVILCVYGDILCDINNAKQKLSDYGYNVYSQFGEDGIVEKIFSTIGVTSKFCIEFGAHDGISCSNTANLWKNKGWKALLIEADGNRFKTCVANTMGYDCVVLNSFVGHEDHNSLESILSKSAFSPTIDLLSIDIDGDDYHILKSLKSVRPRVIICEYNASIPACADIFFAPNNHIGCSAGALIRVARSLGYSLIGMNLGNCFFVLDELSSLFNNFITDVHGLQSDLYTKFLISSYQGEVCVVGKTDMSPWGYQGKTYNIKNICDEYRLISNLRIH